VISPREGKTRLVRRFFRKLLSPEFLKKEFPQQYDAAATKPRHPAEQLQFFLNALGKENWEMVEAAQVGPLLMFFFKRPCADA
jgi:hypothetical protein